MAGFLSELNATSDETIQELSPLAGAVFARVPASSHPDVERAIKTTRDFQLHWAGLPARQRAGHLLRQAGVPAQAWQIVAGSGPQVVAGTDMICFTGSTDTGRGFAASAGEQLMSISAEPGGKNAALVLADADIQTAVVGGCVPNLPPGALSRPSSRASGPRWTVSPSGNVRPAGQPVQLHGRR